MFEPQIDVGTVQADADIFAFAGSDNRLSGALPSVSVYYSSDAPAVAVEIYLAPAGGGAGADRIELLTATTASSTRSCYAVPITPAGRVWHLFISKPDTGGAGSAFVRIQWDAGGEGR
jgi:hypothetical protein